MNITSDKGVRSTKPGLRVKGLRSSLLSAESIEVESTPLLMIMAVLVTIVSASALIHFWR